jgi:hypothetical protein
VSLQFVGRWCPCLGFLQPGVGQARALGVILARRENKNSRTVGMVVHVNDVTTKTALTGMPYQYTAHQASIEQDQLANGLASTC